jgi:hypothetical protein
MFFIIELPFPGDSQVKMRKRFGDPGKKRKTIMPFDDRIFIPSRKITATLLLENPVNLIHQSLCLWDMLINMIAYDDIDRMIMERESHRVRCQKMNTGR